MFLLIFLVLFWTVTVYFGTMVYEEMELNNIQTQDGSQHDKYTSKVNETRFQKKTAGHLYTCIGTA